MTDYYIRTPEHDESRGPFDTAKLLTLADAGQINENTLYYDEDKEEWIPIALNEDLKAQVFPKREKLSLDVASSEENESTPESEEETGLDVEDMLKAAEADTEETRHLKQSQKSFEKSVAVASMTLGVIMLVSAASFIVPHLTVIQGVANEQFYSSLLNYPFLIVGALDLLIGILLLLSVTDIYPIVRGRSMLGLGFGVYVGWAVGDPLIMLGFGLSGIGLFVATISQKISITMTAIIMGFGGAGLLLYLASIDRLDGFYSTFQLTIFG